MVDWQTKRLLGVVIAAAILLAIGCVIWAVVGLGGVTEGDAIIIGIGVLATVLLAGGLMAAMFYSDRSGFDR